MPDEAGKFTAEHTVMDKNLEIGEQAQLLNLRDKIISDLTKRVKELEEEVKRLQPKDSHYVDDVDYAAAEEADSGWHIEENKSEEKQLSFELS